MAVPRAHRLDFRSLHYKELIIFLNLLPRLLEDKAFDNEGYLYKKIHLLRSLIACKIIEDTGGYIDVRTLSDVLNVCSQTARKLIRRLAIKGFLIKTVIHSRKHHYHMRPISCLDSLYPKIWYIECERLLSYDINMPTIRYMEGKRTKRDVKRMQKKW